MSEQTPEIGEATDIDADKLDLQAPVDLPATSDAEEFLELAARLPVRAEVETCRLEEANDALLRLGQGRIHGAAVLTMA